MQTFKPWVGKVKAGLTIGEFTVITHLVMLLVSYIIGFLIVL